MPLGKEVGLGPGHIVLDGDPVGTQPPQQPLPTFDPCLLWPNGRLSQQLLSSCVLYRPSAPHPSKHSLPNVLCDVKRVTSGKLLDILMVTLSMAEHVQQTITVYNQRLCSLRDCP